MLSVISDKPSCKTIVFFIFICKTPIHLLLCNIFIAKYLEKYSYK